LFHRLNNILNVTHLFSLQKFIALQNDRIYSLH